MNNSKCRRCEPCGRPFPAALGGAPPSRPATRAKPGRSLELFSTRCLMTRALSARMPDTTPSPEDGPGSPDRGRTS